MKSTPASQLSLTLPFLLLMLCFLLVSCSKTGGGSVARPAGLTGSVPSVGPVTTNGNLLYYSNGAAPSSIGCLGDYYLDISDGLLYGPKSSIGWGNAQMLKNSTGAGSNIFSGTGSPAPATGNTGDYFISTSGYLLYGPKTNNGWGIPINLQTKNG